MASTPNGARRTPTGRRRGRPPAAVPSASHHEMSSVDITVAGSASEHTPKRKRYIPGGAGGGGRFVDADSVEASVTVATARPRAMSRPNATGASPSLTSRRQRSTRTRNLDPGDLEEMRWGSTAARAASVKQADDYKPREERGWEEFHPNLDIDVNFKVLHAEDVDGSNQVPSTPAPPQTPGTPLHDSMTPSRHVNLASTGNTPVGLNATEVNPFDVQANTPTRRPRRPTRDVVSFYGHRSLDVPNTPKTPKILPIQNQTQKEKLDLKMPSYRRTNRIELFESKTFGQARYIDKSMSNVGYQESDTYIRTGQSLIKAAELYLEDDADQSALSVHDAAVLSKFGRVEYDMDEQDDMWLENYNTHRKQNEMETITREIFEITMTKIEKEWHALEKRMPKPNPKPPQTHRPRSSSAAAVNGEPQTGDEPDSKCAICDDGDCENSNAIVFCDGCNLAVHQECYGVPFIPEGQWLCRKCQLCGRGVPTCIFCPSTDGAFKQTNSSKWAHLLCAMWVPEVSLGNHTFMEPVMDVEKVPRTRWKLSCYICHQRMGACIQCGNKNCYQAFHVTCARRARLFLKMKTSTGALAVLDGSMVLKAFCDKHCPTEYTKENDVHAATRAAKKFFKRNMKGRIWADNHAIANAIAAQHSSAIVGNAMSDGLAIGPKFHGPNDKDGDLPKNVWRLPSGAPVIPQAVFDVVEASIQRFSFRKRKDYLSEACRYWTLKREARRGAALLRRLQSQLDSFSSMELTRRNFAAMGPSGKARLSRRVDFAQTLVQDLQLVKELSAEVVQREQLKLEAARLELDFVDECYFPVAKFVAPAIEKAISLDKGVFSKGLERVQERVNERYHVTALSFAQDLGEAINVGLRSYQPSESVPDNVTDGSTQSPHKDQFVDVRERRKLGKRILKAVQTYVEVALQLEAEISNKPYEALQRELDSIIEAGLEVKQVPAEDVEMGDADANDTSSIAHTTYKGDMTLVDKAQEDTQRSKTTRDSKSAAGEDSTADVEMTTPPTGPRTRKNALDASQTPPASIRYLPTMQSHHAGPPTPPQSNGSLGKDPGDLLADGGVLWYLKSMEPQGTSILEEDPTVEKEGSRSLSEDLTDLDDDELKGLGLEVDMLGSTPTVNVATTTVSPSKTIKTRSTRVSKRRTSARRR